MGRPLKALLLVDHGSRRNEANALIEQVADYARAQLPGWQVGTAHLELAEPDIPSAIDAHVAQGCRELIVSPYFLAPGRHSTRDLPRIVEEARARHPGVRFALAAPLGFDERIASVALDRARSAAEADPEVP